jgi:phosphatidylglycerol---prolipoprotein diacylglyceryl transferase
MFPRLFHIGSFSLPTYGVLVALAFLVALWLAARFAKLQGVPKDSVVNLGVYCALVGMRGAKVLMIALDPEYREHPLEIFSMSTLQSAGIFFGGFILALIFAWFYMRRQHLPVLQTSDLFAPGLALGHGIGRLGCLAAGCCWGRPTHLPWGITFSNPDATTGVPLGIPLQPTQLYEAVGEAIICAILIYRLLRPHREGQIIGLYLALYGALRFGVEFLRAHDASNPFGGPFVLEQWISLAAIVAGIWLMMRRAPVVRLKPVTAPA